MAARGGNPLRGMMDSGQARRRGRLALFGEVYGELARVNWPSRDTAARLTLLVLAIAAVMGVFLGLWDLGFTRLVETLFLD